MNAIETTDSTVSPITDSSLLAVLPGPSTDETLPLTETIDNTVGTTVVLETSSVTVLPEATTETTSTEQIILDESNDPNTPVQDSILAMDITGPEVLPEVVESTIPSDTINIQDNVEIPAVSPEVSIENTQVNNEIIDSTTEVLSSSATISEPVFTEITPTEPEAPVIVEEQITTPVLPVTTMDTVTVTTPVSEPVIVSSAPDVSPVVEIQEQIIVPPDTTAEMPEDPGDPIQ